MAKKNPELYSVSKTFFWFTVSSVLLTICLAGIVVVDYKRDWKDYQKKFNELKLKKANEELKNASSQIDKAALTKLQADKAAAEAEFKSHKQQYDELSKQSDFLANKINRIKSRFQDLKQFKDSYKFYYEDYLSHKNPKASVYLKKMDDLEPRLAKLKTDLEGHEANKEQVDAKIEALLEKTKETQKAIAKALEEQTRIQKKIERIKPTLAKDVLNAPMLDFVAPTLKVQQIVLEGLYTDYHFTKVQKVDRCTTCHLGIDQKGFEDAPQPFRTHPNLDLYLSATSPHSIEKFGCTVCHGGNGHSVSFTDSAHTPKNEEQAKKWEKNYHWKELEKWDEKMFPINHTEAACAKCHHDVLDVPKADKLNRGRKLAQESGCLNCHKLAGHEAQWKVGPSLQNIQTKLSEDFIKKWLDDPKSFRASTKMPQVFHLSNTSSPEDKQRNFAAIASTAAYLVKNSGSESLSEIPVKGDAASGEQLVKTIGCTGCHSVAGVNVNDYAPELTNLGSKVSEKWIYHWVKDPKHMSKDTRMPNMRLNDQQAADIAAYLVQQKNDAFESKSVPAYDPKVVDSMIMDSMQGTVREADAKAQLDKMSPEERLQYLGKKTIAHQGCFSCHAINGFEDSKPIGADIGNEGRKDLHQFDFGFTDIPKTRYDWVTQKLHDPRIFDHGKVKSYYEKLRMPKFNLTDAQIDDITTFVLSQTHEQMPLEMQKVPNLKEARIEQGRVLVEKFNCTGCHTLDGQVGKLRENAEDLGSMPPSIEGEGAKVQEKWLHDFLHAPTPIRPWLTYHMPTFGFTEDELDVMVEYFSYLSNENISYKGANIPATSTEYVAAGKDLFEKLQCAKCHEVNPSSMAMGTSFLAPDLSFAKTRLKPNWVHKWLEDPQKIDSSTMMPAFFADGQSPIADVLEGDAQKQITAIRDYLYVYDNAASKTASASSESKKEEVKA